MNVYFPRLQLRLHRLIVSGSGTHGNAFIEGAASLLGGNRFAYSNQQEFLPSALTGIGGHGPASSLTKDRRCAIRIPGGHFRAYFLPGRRSRPTAPMIAMIATVALTAGSTGTPGTASSRGAASGAGGHGTASFNPTGSHPLVPSGIGGAGDAYSRLKGTPPVTRTPGGPENAYSLPWTKMMSLVHWPTFGRGGSAFSAIVASSHGGIGNVYSNQRGFPQRARFGTGGRGPASSRVEGK